MRKRNILLNMLIITLTITAITIGVVVHAESPVNSIVKNIQNIFEKTGNTIVTSMNTALSMIVKILIKISEVLSIGLVIVGLFLWFSRISPYTGKRLIISAILLFIFAYILKHVYV